MSRILTLAALALAGVALAACDPRQKPEPTIITKEVEIQVPTPCPDRRAAQADYPRTPADMRTRLAAAPNAVERVRKLLEWAPLWMQRLDEDDGQIAACAKAH